MEAIGMELMQAKAGRIIFEVVLGRGPSSSIEEAAKAAKVDSGVFFALGTLKKVRMSFYRPAVTEFVMFEFAEATLGRTGIAN